MLARDLRGRVCLVTGANQGLGFETAKELAKRGCTLYMACRSEDKGKAAVEKVQAESENKDVHLKVVDLASIASIKALAQDLENKQTRLHVLVNNAGVMVRPAPPLRHVVVGTCCLLRAFRCQANDDLR